MAEEEHRNTKVNGPGWRLFSEKFTSLEKDLNTLLYDWSRVTLRLAGTMKNDKSILPNDPGVTNNLNTINVRCLGLITKIENGKRTLLQDPKVENDRGLTGKIETEFNEMLKEIKKIQDQVASYEVEFVADVVDDTGTVPTGNSIN